MTFGAITIPAQDLVAWGIPLSSEPSIKRTSTISNPNFSSMLATIPNNVVNCKKHNIAFTTAYTTPPIMRNDFLFGSASALLIQLPNILLIFFSPLFIMLTILKNFIGWKVFSPITHVIYTLLALLMIFNWWSFSTSWAQTSKQSSLTQFCPLALAYCISHHHIYMIQDIVPYVKYFKKGGVGEFLCRLKATVSFA